MQTSSDMRSKAYDIISSSDDKVKNKREQVKTSFDNAEKLQERVLKSRGSILNKTVNIIRIKQEKEKSVTSPGYSEKSNIKKANLYDTFHLKSVNCFGDSLVKFADSNSSYSIFSGMRERRDAAEEYLSKAKDYRVKVDKLCVEIDSTLNKL